MVPFDAPDIDAIRANAEAHKEAEQQPVLAEAIPSKLDNLMDLHRSQHADTLARFDALEEHLQELRGNASGLHTNSTIIAILFLILMIPVLLMGCGALLTIGSSL